MSDVPKVSGEPSQLTLEELCRVMAVPPEWIVERVRAGLIERPASPGPAPGSPRDEPVSWHFDSLTLHHARSMRRIELVFDAPPELAALVADLEAEIARLRSELMRRGP